MIKFSFQPSQQQVTNVGQTVNIQRTTTTQQQTSTITSGQQEIQVQPEQQQQQQQTITKTTQQVQSVTDSSPGTTPLPIVKRGGFFDDSFFEDSRQHFQVAIRNVLEKFNERNTQTDDLTTYRNLRQRNLKEETQAVTECDSDDIHRVSETALITVKVYDIPRLCDTL